MGSAGFEVLEGDFRGAEQVGINGVEVIVVASKDRANGSPKSWEADDGTLGPAASMAASSPVTCRITRAP